MKKVFMLTIAIMFFLIGNSVYSQTVYRSRQTGTWIDFNTWDRSTDNGVTYVPATSGQAPTSNNSVIIISGTTVTLDATKSCLNLTIQSGGRLSAGATTNAIRPGTSSSGTAGTISSVQNDGILGGPGELGPLELPATCAQLTLTGSGTYEIGRIRAITGNSNFPTSGVAGHANDARLIVDCNIKLNTAANYVFSGVNATASATDVFIFTINAGKTVTVSAPDATMLNNVAGAGGVYTYNINGTLDMSACTSIANSTTFGSYSNAGSAVNLNVSGIFKTGGIVKSTTNTGQPGAVNLAIKTGATVDATITNFQFDPTYPLRIEGTGKIIRNSVGASDTSFPVGTATSYNGVVLNNAGTVDNFTVTVQDAIVNAPPDPTKVVNKQWTITEGTAGGSNVTMKLSWLTADQAASFNPAQTVSILRWTGSAYEAHLATVTGSGTLASPYVATASGFIAFSPFIIANFAVLPITFQTSKAYQKNTGIQVDWSISNDNNASKYVVERSPEGNSFYDAATINAQRNATELNNYSWFDASPLSGNNFYRIKGLDKNGGIKYTSIMKVNIAAGKPSLVISPNPVKGNILNLQLGNAVKGTYTLALYNTAGQKTFIGEVRSEGGSSSQSVQLPSSVKAGTYNLQLNNADSKLSKTIVIE